MGRYNFFFSVFFRPEKCRALERWDEGSVLNTTCASCLYDNSILTTAAVWSTLPLCGSLSVWFHLTSGHVEVFVGNWYDIWDENEYHRLGQEKEWERQWHHWSLSEKLRYFQLEVFRVNAQIKCSENKKMLGAAPSLLAAACRGRRSLLFGNNWKKLGVEVLLLEQVMMFKHVWTTLYFLSLTVKVNNYLMSDWKSQIYSLGCPKVPSGWGPFR